MWGATGMGLGGVRWVLRVGWGGGGIYIYIYSVVGCHGHINIFGCHGHLTYIHIYYIIYIYIVRYHSTMAVSAMHY